MSKVIAVVVILVASTFMVEAQNLSNRGKEFWVGYGHHQFMESGSNSQEMVLYFSAEQPANVTVTINGTSYVRNYKVPANTVISSELIPKNGTNDARLHSPPCSFANPGDACGGVGVFNKGINIKSDVPIVAYAHIYGDMSSGATMLMPVETWGYSYFSVNSKQNYASNCYSWVYAIAKEDNTVIEVTPSTATRNRMPANVPYRVTLMKGEIYQTMAGPESGSLKPEMTGTKIKSVANANGECFPIAVFSGSSRTSNPSNCGSGGGDNDNQQLFPTQAWGKRYLTAPTSPSTSATGKMDNIYKVIVKDPNTKVKLNGTELTNLIAGSYYYYESNTADYIEADQPIMVAQFMSGGGCLNGGVGDPEMIIISPLEQGIKRIGFYRNDEENITTNYLTLIIPTKGVSSLKIDGSSSFSHTYLHPKLAGYTVVIKRWNAAKTQCIVQSDSAFTAITYGLGSVESYGYNAGTLINNLNAVSSIHNVLDASTSEHKFTCTNTPVQLSVLMAYQPTKLQWLLSELGNSISPNTNVIDNAPVASETVTVNGILYYKYTLPGTYTFNSTDTFEIPLLATHPSIENCNNTERIKVEVIVKEKPKADFTFTHLGCTLDTAYLSAGNTTTNNFSLKEWKWEFPGNINKTGQNVNHLFAPGSNDIKLTVVSSDGCISDTIKKINVVDKPSAGFSFSPLSVCEGGEITFTDTAANTNTNPVNSWYWNFDNGTVLNNNTASSPKTTFTGSRQYTIKHVVKTSATCISDTVTKIIDVYAKPTPSFTYPVGCLPLDGKVQFTNTTTVSDGQNISAYAWDFGDANATSSNPNNSSLKDPTHIYTSYGDYKIKLTVTTENGCTKDTVVTAKLNIRPQLSFDALTAVCENVTGNITVAKGKVTNGVSGKGYYTGPGTDSSGNFKPTVAGVGDHKIWYVFESTGGCKDSLSQNIKVHASAKPAFSYPSGGCLADGTVQFTNTTTIADAQSLTYLWNFNDPAATTTNPNTSTLQHPSHTYTNYGTYNINLSITTEFGCTADTTIKATFSIQPKTTYPVLQSICESAGPLSVAKASVTNGVPGTGVYKGKGTDAAGNFTPATAGAGVHTIWYVFTSTSGCMDSSYSTIKVHPKPVSKFVVNSNICLDQAATITDNSTITSGNIKTWSWDFGDGNTVTNNNNAAIIKYYNSFKTYTIKLVTESDSSCISDAVTQTINVHPLPVADFNLPTAVCMPGGAATFKNNTAIANNSSLIYMWNFGDGSATSSNTNPSHVYASSGSYNISLTATSAFGCTHDTVKVLNAFYDKPIANFTVNRDTLCQGTESIFNDISTAPGSTVKTRNWVFGDGSTSTSLNAKKTYSLPGKYNVTLTVTNEVGCAADVTKEVVVNLQPKIDAGPSFVVPLGTTVLFNPKVNDSTTLKFYWSPASDFADATVLRPSLTAMYNQTYYLTAVGESDCMAVDSLKVSILKPVKVPNAFSPNGDNINDTWIINDLNDYPGATVEVYNRYGQLVFQTNGYSKPWDGTFNGKPLPLATYYYVITLKNGFAPITGSITIIK